MKAATNFDYHTAALDVSTGMVIDPQLSTGPLTISEWMAKMYMTENGSNPLQQGIALTETYLTKLTSVSVSETEYNVATDGLALYIRNPARFYQFFGPYKTIVTHFAEPQRTAALQWLEREMLPKLNTP